MRMRDTLWMATNSLAANPIRSLLTMLGIVIGVGCVVCMAAIGAGARARVIDQIRSFGANVLAINPAAKIKDGVRGSSGPQGILTTDDAKAIAALPVITATASSVFGNAQVVHGSQNWGTSVNGTTSSHFSIREWRLKWGRMFEPEEDQAAAKVAILGATVAEKLFDREDPVGQIVRILNTPFTVLGVLSEKGASAGSQSQDDVVFVPLTTATRRLMGSTNAVNRDAVAFILASAKSYETIPDAAKEVTSLLRQRHKMAPGQDDDFTVTTAASVLAVQQELVRTMSILLGSIAAVSLVVGGIGIMNIMLVCVTERTSEIGLRLAVGARPRDVRRQFLLEAVVICTVGGIFGVLGGSVAAWGIANSFDWPILIQPWIVAIAVVLASAVGVFFGYYPAKRASALQPIIALRQL